jgi:Tfp pilus assembly protein PilF
MNAEQLFFEGDKKIKEGNYTEGRDLLLQAIELDPKYGRAYNHLGWLYDVKYKDLAKADEMYKKALELSPEYTPIYGNYSVVLSDLKKYDELVALLEKGLQTPGVDARVMYGEYGRMYEKQEEYEKAIENYTKAMKQSWTDEDMKFNEDAIARCKKKMG